MRGGVSPAVVILGGTGVFGSRLAERLARFRDLRLIVAGRNKDKAKKYAAALRGSMGHPSIEGESFILGPSLGEQLTRIAPDLVVHAAGPFQGQDYSVAEAALTAGAHYVDLADGREFVLGFAARLDSIARNSGLIAVTGASSVPALSSAVVFELAKDIREVTSIEIGISPGNRAPRGDAVIRAILSYCGKPIAGWADGAPKERFGWQGLRREIIGDLGPRWFCDCDVPDIQLFAQAYPKARDIRFGAGLELGVLHLGLWGLAALVRSKMLPPLDRFSGLLRPVANLFEPFGSNAGGMFVRVVGISREGLQMSRCWQLLAKQGDGPYVPTLPAAIIVRKILTGGAGVPGARTSFEAMMLKEFVDEAAGLHIKTGITDVG